MIKRYKSDTFDHPSYFLRRHLWTLEVEEDAYFDFTYQKRYKKPMLVFSPFLNVNNYGLLIGLILKNDYAILAHPVTTNPVEYCEFI